MRFVDLVKIQKVVSKLEQGETPTAEEIQAARKAVDRENDILEKRRQRNNENLMNAGYVPNSLAYEMYRTND